MRAGGHELAHDGPQALVGLVVAGGVHLVLDGGGSAVGVVLVSDDTDLRVGLVQRAAVVSGHGTDPVVLVLDGDEVVTGSGLDDDIVSLADADQDGLGIVGFDGHEIVGDDLKDMFVDGEDEGGGGGGVDEANQIPPSSLEDLGVDGGRGVACGGGIAGLGAIEPAAPVQDVGLHGRRSDKLLDVVVLEGAVVAPVAEHEGLDGLVVIGRRWAMEGHRAGQAVRVLEGVMAVIPGRSVLGHVKPIRVAIARGNGALGHAVDAVVLELVQHPGAMPMDGRAVVVKVVDDGDLERVAPTGLDPRPGILLVEGLAPIPTLEAIGVDGMLVGSERVLGIGISLWWWLMVIEERSRGSVRYLAGDAGRGELVVIGVDVVCAAVGEITVGRMAEPLCA